MTARKSLLLAGLPALGGLVLLLTAGMSHRPSEPELGTPRKVRTVQPVLQTSPPPSVEATLPPAPAEQIAVAVEDARLRGTYSNFRTAVATGNAVLEESLRKILERDRRAALALAEEELRVAAAPLDREIALKTLESLRK